MSSRHDLRGSFHPCVEALEGRLAPAVHTWTGAAGNLWSDDANWNGGSPAGDPDAQLVFPHVLANRENRNDLDGLTVRSLTFASSTGYGIRGNPITLIAGAEINAQGIPDYPTRNSISCAFVLEADLRILANGILFLSGVISGDHAVSVAGRIPVNLLGANTYTGGTTVSGSVSNWNPDSLGTGEITLNGGTLYLSTLQLANPFRVRGSARIFGAPETFTLTGPGILEPGSTLRVVGDRSDIALAGGVSGAGGVSVEQESTLRLGGKYNQLGRLDVREDSAVLLEGGTLAAESVNVAAGSSFAGSGVIEGNVINAGLLDVGGPAAAGQLVIVGDYVQTATGTLRLELGDFDSGNYDRLDVTGTATLDGTLSVALLDDFFAREGDVYAVLTWGEHAGSFAAIELPDLGEEFDLDPRFGDEGLTLWVVARL